MTVSREVLFPVMLKLKNYSTDQRHIKNVYNMPRKAGLSSSALL